MDQPVVIPSPALRDRIDLAVARVGDFLLVRRSAIQAVQWIVVGVYIALVVVPAVLPLPASSDHIWSSFSLLARFVFWGVWWPLVLVATMLIGRVWCGVFCPEGTLSQFASRHGRGGAIPKWVQWPGWPFAAFALTTVYGQLVSVYQYPQPALLVLGGSTLAAMLAGYLWGRDKRVWCRFLCPVNGVFRVLAKLSLFHFRVDPVAWERSRRSGIKPGPVRCAPMVAIKTMRGADQCQMCGLCSGYRGAIRLALRSPNHEIINVAGERPDPWETALIVVGLMGVAVGAFLWSASPWLVSIKLWAAKVLLSAGIAWPLTSAAPWWVLTNMPARNDVLSLLDGALVLLAIAVVALVNGTIIGAALALATRLCGHWSWRRFHHLAQALIPLAGGGVFLGLSATTVTLLSQDGFDMRWASPLRALILIGMAAWTLGLAWSIAARYAPGIRRTLAAAAVTAAVLPPVGCWCLLFWGW